MGLILGIETSCDETAAAVFDTKQQKILSNELFSQTSLHEIYGGVVPEIASRSHLEKIDIIVSEALSKAGVELDDIETIAATNRPGLAGSLLVGFCFGKTMAWAKKKNFVGVDHHAGHIYSAFLRDDNVCRFTEFPFIALSVSGGHPSLYLVRSPQNYELIGGTIDDAAGEAFDKISKLMGFGYPGGPIIEKLASSIGFEEFFDFPRGRKMAQSLNFSFSGLKTAVLYKLVELGAYDFKSGLNKEKMTDELAAKVASSFMVCVKDIFTGKVKLALKKFPEARGFALVGGVACNKYLRSELQTYCEKLGKFFVSPPTKFCTDNGAMIACAAAHGKIEAPQWDLDVFDDPDKSMNR
ncbi:tRNA (adenosine(37)-N6)-threonylcarbamoyltransferase complex transferase subunit TsaD [bacterium]|nr:tRNA (adenosine(37)-N6)-threonylcarbamoyltransferase complex transferase subunit TsaD [bacterium]